MTLSILAMCRSIALAAALAAIPCAAAPPAQASAEIDHLRDYLAGSGCRFERNGQWHDVASARKHIDRKYRYLVDRDQVASAEQFIERAASTSSSSGKPYRVQCGDAKPVAASRWFTEELRRLRRQ